MFHLTAEKKKNAEYMRKSCGQAVVWKKNCITDITFHFFFVSFSILSR